MKLVFFGPPGVGKGTYASRTGPLLGIPHISTGDLVRKEIGERSELGQRIREFSDRGLLVPDEIITGMLKARLRQRDAKLGFILDGYPRTLVQAGLLEKVTAIDMVINIRLRNDLLVRKIAGRRVCRSCGETYNVADIREKGITMPPLLPKKEGVCDACGGQLYQRDDDREAVVSERLRVYREQTIPLEDHYRKRGILHDVDVTGTPAEMVPAIVALIRKVSTSRRVMR